MRRLQILVVLFFSIGGSVWCQTEGMKSDTGSFVDVRDGQEYPWIKIGEQVWMKRNLNYTSSGGSFCYNHDSAQCSTYGRLYEWATALHVCPDGWHLPTRDEWDVLSKYLADQVGEKLKELGNTHWQGVDAVVRGDSGFDALPAGYKGVDEMGRTFYLGITQYAFFWSSTPFTPYPKAWSNYLSFEDDALHLQREWRVFGYSVRCIRND